MLSTPKHFKISFIVLLASRFLFLQEIEVQIFAREQQQHCKQNGACTIQVQRKMVTHLRLIEDKQPLTFTGISAYVARWLAVTSLPTLWNADRKPTVWCGQTFHQNQP